jgi:hypothetical protein
MGRASLLLLASCGRIGFDPATLAPPDAELPSFFVSPTGNDAGAGTRADPWGTLPISLGRLHPGDRLTLLDGDYDTRLLGKLSVQCASSATACGGHACDNGSPTAPITVRADHERAARLFGRTKPIELANCSDWVIDGLYAVSLDDAADPNGQVVHLTNSQSIELHHMLVQSPNRYGNNHAIEISHSTNVLVEDTEVYDFFRSAIDFYLSHNVTLRRFYANGRGAADIPGGYTSSCAGGDEGVLSYYAGDILIEDVIVEAVCGGVRITAGRNTSGDTNLGDNHRVFDAIAIGPGKTGFQVFSDCDASAPCNSPDRFGSGNTFTNVVATGFDIGLEMEGQNNRIVNATALGGSAGITLTVYASSGGLAATAYVTSALVAGATNGVYAVGQADWSVQTSNVFSATTPYSPNDAHVTGSLTIDPVLGGCVAYLPPSSPMRTAAAGKPIGAEIRTRSVDGVATAQPFWDPQTGKFPCGAVVAGVNDNPASSCAGVHTRLAVGTGGCALP